LPLTVVIQRDGLILRDGPGQHFNAINKSLVDEKLPVLNIKFDAEGAAWYRLMIDDMEMWIDGEHAQSRFSIPSLHFLAGLYYFRSSNSQYKCHYQLAANQFSQFIDTTQDSAKNTNLATAHQLFAASLLRSSEACGRDNEKAINAYTAAIDLTPHDTTAYKLRAVSTLGIGKLSQTVVSDLQNALKLDNQDGGTRTTVETLQMAISQGVVTEPAELIQKIDHMHRTLTHQHVARNIARIRHQQHLPMKTKGRRVLPIPEEDVQLTFHNQTGAYLDLYIFKNESDENSGDSYHLQLPDGEKAPLHITEGTYEIAVEGPNSDVKSIYGEHAYSSKSHYKLNFRVELSDVLLKNGLR